MFIFEITHNDDSQGPRIQVLLETWSTSLKPKVENNEQWLYLNDNEPTKYYVTVTIPSDAAFGDHLLQYKTFFRQSDQGQDYQETGSGNFRLTVVKTSTSSDSPNYLGGIMTISLIGILIYLAEKKHFLLSAFGIIPAHWRLESDKVLENQGRAKVFETIRASDGISLSQLVKETSMSKSTVRYALRVLMAFNYIVQGPNRYYYLPGKNISHLTNTQAEIIHKLESREMFRQEELARAVGLTRAGLSHQMDILIKRGDIERVKKGRQVYYRPNTKLDKPEHWWEASGN